jgi:hypothetical protein
MGKRCFGAIVYPNPFYTVGFTVINRSGVGVYTASGDDNAFGLDGTSTGFVSAYGDTARYCKISSWFPLGFTLFFNILCFDKNGLAADARWVAGWKK